jgi:hypothetical protein
VVPDDLHDFFVAAAGVAGALVGLLFVAISIAAERLTAEQAEAQVHRVRALAALAAFVDALVVSLVALLPGASLGPAVSIVAAVGVLLVALSLLSLFRAHQLRGRQGRESLFLVGLLVVFGLQMASAVLLIERPGDVDVVGTIAVLVLVCFMVGIGRAWELVGAPSVTALLRPGAVDRSEDLTR